MIPLTGDGFGFALVPGDPYLADMVHPEGMTEASRMAGKYLAERRKMSEITFPTWRVHTYVLAGFCKAVGHRHVKAISKREVNQWMQEIGHLAAATRRNRVSIVNGFLDWLVEHDKLHRNPMTGMRRPSPPRSVPRALPLDAVQKALAAAPDQRARLIIVLMVQQGLRRAEVAGLQRGDMDLTHRQMRVIGKGGHERFVYITAETLTELVRYTGMFPASSGPLIRSYTIPSQGLTPTMVGRIITRVFYDAGIKNAPRDGISGHALRHTAATDMLRNGAHVRDVQQVLGHANLATTQVYMPRMVSTLEQAMEGRSYDA